MCTRRCSILTLIFLVLSFGQTTRTTPAAEVQCTRAFETKQTLKSVHRRMILHLLKGLGQSEASHEVMDELSERIKRLEREVAGQDVAIDIDVHRDFHLLIDNQEVKLIFTNVRTAVEQIVRYAIHESGTLPGSVELRFAYTVNGVRVRRSDFVEDNHIHVVAELDGDLPKADYVRIDLDARQPDGQRVVFTSSACVHVCIGRRPCGPVTKIAERIMARLVDEQLVRLSDEMRELIERDESNTEENDLAKTLLHHVHQFRQGLRR